MSSWSWYVKSYEVKCCYELPSPTNAQFWHDSCVRLKELPSKLVSHAYLIFRNKQDISCFAPLVTFGNFQQGFTNFLCLTWSAVIGVTQLSQSYHPQVDTSKVMKQNITMSFPAIQMHNSDMTVVSGSKSYPQSWCHMPTLFSEISEISHVLHLWWLLVTSSRVSPIFSVWPDQRSSVYLNYHSYVILKLICQKLWSKMLLWASQPYKCTSPTSQLCQSWIATLKVGVTCLPYFQK